jgi:hypothetical protein
MTAAKTAKQVFEELPIKRLPALEHSRVMSLYGAIGEITLPGDYAEFGVFRGHAARVIFSLMTGERLLHLFDSFEGLPEDWLDTKKAGAFKLAKDKIPQFNRKRTRVYKGWFKDTVPEFAKTMTSPLAFIHMDADLYSSTIDVLHNINHLVVPGTIILFDEYMMPSSDDEHRALLDWSEKFDRKFDYLWRTEGPQVCTRVTK